jgi:glutamine amidotransferase
LPGLGYIDGTVKKFDTGLFEHKPHLPHLGWNSILTTKRHEIFNNIDTLKGFYFLHTYYFQCNSESDILAQTEYGGKFSSAITHNNV